MSKIKIDVARKPVTFVRCEERHAIFAPSWELLTEYKGGALSWAGYTARYLDEMRTAFRGNPELFFVMARRLDNVEFICWCCRKKGNDARCHRFLLRELLSKVRSSMTVC